MAQGPIKVGLIGTGLSTKVFHSPFIASLPNDFVLTAIVERKATPQKSVARDMFGDKIQVFTSVEELVKSKAVELLIVNSPNTTHHDYAKLALENGINVGVEKPLCPTSKEAYELCALATAKNLVLAPFQNRRFDSDFLTLSKLLRAGKLGDLVDFETTFDRFKSSLKGGDTWKEQVAPGSGLLYDLGSHLIDQVLALFGTPASITAFKHNARQLGPDELDDTFIVLMHYHPAPGTPGRRLPFTVTARNTFMSPIDPQLRYQIRGTGGSFVKYGVDPQEDQLKASADAISSSSYGVEDPSIAGTLTPVSIDGAALEKPVKVQSERGDYRLWFKAVAEAVRGGGNKELAVKPEEAAEVIRIIELAQKSIAERRTIDVPPRL